MIEKVKNSRVLKSIKAPRGNVGVKNILTDNARDVGPILQFSYF